MPRSRDELVLAIAAAGFTPGARDAEGLVALLADEALAERELRLVGKALAKLGGRASALVAQRFANLGEEAAARPASPAELALGVRLLHALGALASTGDAAAVDALIGGVHGPVERWRRAAITELGRLGGRADSAARPALAAARQAVLARWDRGALDAPEQRALAEALGKLGGAEAAQRLQALGAGDDRELARRRDRAVIMSQRDERGVQESELDASVALAPGRVRWACRAGLGPLLADELRALGLRVDAVAPDCCVTAFEGPLSRAFAARLWTHLGWLVALPAGPLDQAVAEALAAPAVRARIDRATRGPLTWRLELRGGPRRAEVWQIVRAVAAREPSLHNQPKAAAWTFVVDDAARALELRPRKLADPRFAWREVDLPSASHPTVAAAIARLAAPRPGERVWDPFVGSGSELIECARYAGAPLTLLGSDLDPGALAAAAQNLRRAELAATLEQRDARTPAWRDLDVIASNPPLGGRLRGDAPALLCEAVASFAAALAPGGRMVWVTPAPRRTEPATRAAGLVLARALEVDLGGLRARLERWEKRR